MKPGYESAYPKHSYIGSPVKAIAHPCTCGKKAGKCTCGHENAGGICTAVVDDASGKVYLYGNVVHENYHVPGNACIAYTAVESAGFEVSGRLGADELFIGEQDNNNVTLEHTPFLDNRFLVFLNGVKQVEGPENDYTVNGQQIHFNFYQLLPTDRVEVMYEYGAE